MDFGVVGDTSGKLLSLAAADALSIFLVNDFPGGGVPGGLILGTSGVASLATDGDDGGLVGVTFGATPLSLSTAFCARNFATLKAVSTRPSGINSSPTISDTSFLVVTKSSSLSSLSETFLYLDLSLDLFSSKDSLLKILLTISISASETPNLLCNVTDIPYSKLHLFILLYIIYVIWIVFIYK